MTSTSAAINIPDRKLVILLASLPTFDCIINQLNNAQQIFFGPLSLLQLVRGNMLALFIGCIAWSLIRNSSVIKRVPLAAGTSFLLIGMIVSKEMVVMGTLYMESIGAYGQMIYWVMYWITISLVCRLPEQAEIMLRGLAAGAMATAISVFAGFIFGAQNFYSDDGVMSSAGWFDTAKMITAVMCVGGVVLLYLNRNKRGWVLPVCAWFCFAGCMATYARAGAAALGAVLLWLLLWYFMIAKVSEKPWLSRFMVLTAAAALLLPVVGGSMLFSRWGDVQDTDKGGSGRASFWRVAVDGYANTNLLNQTFGRGYVSMSGMLFTNYGANIKHTHNDSLDMLLVAGVPGVAWLLLLYGGFVRRAARTDLRTVDGAASMAIVVIYLFHSQLTGQLWGTDAMSYYTIALTCIYTIASSTQGNAFAYQLNRNGSIELAPA